MTILDNNLVFSDAQAITATAASTEYVDQLAAGGAINQPWLTLVTEADAFNTLTSLTISVQCHEDSAFSTGTRTVFSQSIALAALTANTKILQVKLPIMLERYIRLYYTVVGSNPTTGALTAYMSQDISARTVADA